MFLSSMAGDRNSHKISECKKRNHKESYKSLSSKVYGSFILKQKILHCYCGDNEKCRLLQNAYFKESTNMPVAKISK